MTYPYLTMTEEREDEIRDALAETAREMGIGEEYPDPHPSDVALSELLVELDALRALPVISCCDECGYIRSAGEKGSSEGYCVRKHSKVQDIREAPPVWCPLRGRL